MVFVEGTYGALALVVVAIVVDMLDVPMDLGMNIVALAGIVTAEV